MGSIVTHTAGMPVIGFRHHKRKWSLCGRCAIETAPAGHWEPLTQRAPGEDPTRCIECGKPEQDWGTVLDHMRTHKRTGVEA
jgi:hypothetical protein